MSTLLFFTDDEIKHAVISVRFHSTEQHVTFWLAMETFKSLHTRQR